jgi:hypothetical protein
MGSFYEVVATLKDFIFVGYLKFPMIMTGTLMILGLAQVNTAYLFMTLGIFALFSCVYFLQLLFNFLAVKESFKPWLTVPTRETCSILDEAAVKAFSIPSTTRPDPLKGLTVVTPSYYMSFILFFFSYIFFNGLHLFNKDPGPSAESSPDSLDNRKYQAMMGMILALAGLLAFTIIRLKLFSCETALGVFFSLPAAYLAYVWYNLLVDCGEDRMSDMFGILGRLMPVSMDANQPTACMEGS